MPLRKSPLRKRYLLLILLLVQSSNLPARSDPDRASDAVSYDSWAKSHPIPRLRNRKPLGAVLKFFGNQYGQGVADGMSFEAKALRQKLMLVAAPLEFAPSAQLALTDQLLKQGLGILLLSPQTDRNLLPAVEKAHQRGIPIVNVDGAVLPKAEHWVGPNHFQSGVLAARYFQSRAKGGAVAVLKGGAGVFETNERTRGFTETLSGSRFRIVAAANADGNLQKAIEEATAILERHPHLLGFYCNSERMTFGVLEAVKRKKKIGKVMVIGNGGSKAAYEAIRAGELTGTVDSFPFRLGQISVELALRILEGQSVPRVVYSPQKLFTRENLPK